MPRLHYRHWALVLAMSLALAALGYAIWEYASAPAIGRVGLGGSAITKSYQSQPTMKQLVGRYLTFSYPAEYELNRASAITAADSFFLSHSQYAGFEHLAVTVDVSVSALSENPQFNLRHQDASYVYTTQASGGDHLYFFTRSAPTYEHTVFIQHGDLLAGIAYTAGSVPTNADPDPLAAVIAGLKWQR